MIIDAREHSHPDFAEGSLLGAIYSHLEGVEKGDSIDVQAVYNKDGERVSNASFRTALSRLYQAGKVRTRAHFMRNDDCFVVFVEDLAKRVRESGNSIEVVLDTRKENTNDYFPSWTVSAALYCALRDFPAGTNLIITFVARRKPRGQLNPGYLMTAVRGAVRSIRMTTHMDIVCNKTREGYMLVRRLK
jgi:hypothetical protein